jgi:hypothetical protein
MKGKMMELVKGAKYKVLGTTDYPVCDCCGKTNLTRAVGLESESGEVMNVGVICASKLLRQVYQGKKHPVSQGAIINMGKAARASDAWKQRNGYTAPQLVAA